MNGSLETLLLTLIEKEDLYGYEIAKRLKELSNELYSIGEVTAIYLISSVKRHSCNIPLVF